MPGVPVNSETDLQFTEPILKSGNNQKIFSRKMIFKVLTDISCTTQNTIEVHLLFFMKPISL